MLNIKMQSQEKRLKPRITVVGVGGAGGNAVNNMINSNLEGCEFLVCNTDAQALENSIAQQKIQLGVNVTRGLGAGANPEIGGAAAEETLNEIMTYLEGSNMVFVTAGMGGGTGTGAAPVIAQAAREQGILTVGVVTKPFHFEGTTRMKLAENGIEELQKYVDTLIVIPNQNLFRIANEKTTFADAFCMADEVLQSGVRGVTDLMVMSGLINLDFADIRSVMEEMGKAMMGTGEGEGERRAVDAAEAAISNPLLDDVSMKGARGVLINITGGSDMTLFDVDEAANRIRDEVDPNANIIFGSTFDDTLDGRMRVSVVATGIEASEMRQPRPVPLTNLSSDAVRNTTPSTSHYAATQQTTLGTQPVVRGNDSGSASTMDRQSVRTGGLDYNNIPPSVAPTTGPGVMHQGVTASSTQRTMSQSKTQTGDNLGNTTGQMQVGQYSSEATTPSYAATATAEKTVETEEVDVSITQTRPMQNPVKTQRPMAAQPRAERHGNNFIPPAPVNPAGQAAGADPFAEADMVNGLTQKTVQAPVEERPAPSLFERFTGRKRNDIPTAPAKQQPEVKQQTLNVEAGGKKQEEDDLNIPAFLRRQAN